MNIFIWARRINQGLFLLFFLSLVILAHPILKQAIQVEWFLNIDPLIAIGSALATGHLHNTMAWVIPLIVATLFLGRFFCGWMCPFGTLHQIVSQLKVKQKKKEQIRTNLPRSFYRVKYFILLIFLILSLWGSNQVGWLDPIAFSWRAFSTAIIPAMDHLIFNAYQGDRYFQWSWIIGLLFCSALLLNLWIPRLYCRMLCPLGALLGLLAKFSWFRLGRETSICKDCNVCGAHCQGAAEPQAKLKVHECMLCLNCQNDCPQSGLDYQFQPVSSTTTDHLDLGRRQTIGTLVAGAISWPLLKTSRSLGLRSHPECIRPPGAIEEDAFIGKCIQCGVCMKVCPTGGLQPAWHEAGLEGLWTPVLKPRLGHCEHSCVLCSEVCPTGALQKISIAKKVGDAPHTEPIRIGSAFFDRGRCLPWAMDIPCIVCEEVCPTSPKAIYYKTDEITDRQGHKKRLKRPYVDLKQCVGCGVCEAHCPVYDKAAVRVTSVGESRSMVNKILLSEGKV